MNKIGIFGGVFNPPHNFHFSVAQEILNDLPDFKKIIFVPVGDKYKKDELIPAKHRYNMIKLVCDENENFEVSSTEIQASEQPYAYQTLDKLSTDFPNSKLYFIIGTDSLKTLNTWKKLDYLLTKYSFLVYPRGNDDFYKILEGMPQLQKYKNNLVYLSSGIFSSLNSSYLRSQIKSKKNIRYFVPDKIFNYIVTNKLYE